MDSLRSDVDALATQTWRLIDAGDRRRIRLREDTITEQNLLSLDLRHKWLTVYRFNPTEEADSGADWDWYIGSGSRWFRVRIQAKRMDKLEYRKLQHEGAGNQDNYQYDTIIRTSTNPADGVTTFPYYVFFNGWSSWPTGMPWFGCPRGYNMPACRHLDYEHLGCAAMPAELVRRQHGGRGAAGRKVSEYLPYSVPWSWLLGAPQGMASPQGPPRSAHARTVEAFKWHRGVQRTARDVVAGTLGGTRSRQPTEGDDIELLWQRAYRRYSRFRRVEDELAPLPWHVRAVREATTSGSPGLLRELESVSLPPRTPRNMAVFDLDAYVGLGE